MVSRWAIALWLGVAGTAAAQPPEREKAGDTPAAKEEGGSGAKAKAGGAGKASKKDGGDTEEEAPKESAAKSKPLPGDVVTLKSGKVLTGGQVLRETPVGVEVLSAPGLPAFKIPAKHVQSIQYDEIDPNVPGWEQRASGQPAPAAAGPDAISGVEMQPEFHEKITKPLSDAPIAYGEKDLKEILADLRERTGAALRMTEAARALPPAQRMWNLTIPAGARLTDVMQNDFGKALPNLRPNWQFDALVIGLADEEVKAAEKPAAAASAAPTAAETPAAEAPAADAANADAPAADAAPAAAPRRNRPGSPAPAE